MSLNFNDKKYDYFWDDYSNKYSESFWINEDFVLQEPLSNEIDFPVAFKESNYKNYSAGMNVQLKF